MDTRNKETYLVFATLVDAVKEYPDQKISFPVTSIRGVEYVFILYSYDANNLFSNLLKSITVKDILPDYTKYHDYLKERGFNYKKMFE